MEFFGVNAVGTKSGFQSCQNFEVFLRDNHSSVEGIGWHSYAIDFKSRSVATR
jgi:hypothetical protein